MHRQAYISIGKAVATISHATGDQQKSEQLVNKLTALLDRSKQNTTTDSLQLFAILTLGELGRIDYTIFDLMQKKISYACAYYFRE